MINLFPEFIDTKSGGKEVAALFMCPGLDFFQTVDGGPVRGMHVTGSVLYAVSGSKVFSITTSGVVSLLGSITTSAGPVSFIDNGTQTAFFDGSQGYLISPSGALSTISLPFSFPTSATYQDGFGVANQANSTNWYQSNLNDLSTWSALNFATSAAKPTSVVALFSINREIWVFKTTNTEIWINAGNSGLVFQRLDGVFIEFGCLAAASVAKAGESLVWLGQSDQSGTSQPTVFISRGHSAQRISTHAIEFAMASYPTPSDAVGYTYQQEGHLFYVLTFVAGNATWVLDITESEKSGVPVWHQRAAFLNGSFNRHWGNCYAPFNGLNLIGDYLTGNIYALNMNTKLDNGTQRKWLRTWRALQKPVVDPMRFNSLQIDMQTGIGVPDGTTPQCMLRWSDDGGHKWSNPRIGSIGKPGETGIRVKFNRLGSTRRNSGLDRIFELSSSDQNSVAIIGADLT